MGQLADLPDELLEQIFLRLDVRRLTLCRAVCRRWAALVDRLESKEGFWRQAASLVLAPDILHDVDVKTGLSMSEGEKEVEEEVSIDSEKNWRKAYLTWAWAATPARLSTLTTTIANPSSVSSSSSLSSLSSSSHSSMATLSTSPTSSSLSSPVTCLALSGDLLISGHQSGERFVSRLESGEAIGMPLLHQGPVACLHPVDLLQKAPYHSGLDHHALISGGMEGGLILSVLLDPYSAEYKEEQEVKISLRRHNGPVLAITGLGSLFAVLSAGDNLVIWRLNKPATEERLPGVQCWMVISSPSQQLAAITLNHNRLVQRMLKLVGVDTEGKGRVFAIGKQAQSRWESREQVVLVKPLTRTPSQAATSVITLRSSTVSKESLGVVLADPDNQQWSIKVAKAWMFKDNLFFILSSKGEFFCSVDGCHYVHHKTEGIGTVTSLAFHVNLLAIGTEAGHLLLFCINDPVEALAIQVGHPLWQGKVDGIVTGLSIGIGQRLTMVANTKDEMTAISWRSADIPATKEASRPEDSYGIGLD